MFQKHGTWHIMHQCDGAAHGRPGPCGGGHEGPLPGPVAGEETYWHSWGPVVSRDGVRWQRVADALTPTVGLSHSSEHGGDVDGAVSFPDGDGEPVIMFGIGDAWDFQEGLPLVTGLARLKNVSDTNMVHWSKRKPLTFANGSAPCALAGRVWRSKDNSHYSMVCVTVGMKPPGSRTLPDARYETPVGGAGLEGPWKLADARFACPGPTAQYDGCVRGESGPTMFWPLPNQPTQGGRRHADAPTHVLSDAGGGSFTVGTFDDTTETFRPLRSVGTNGSFATAGGVAFSAAGQADDGRLLFVGWVGAGAPPAGGWSPLCLPPPNSSKSWLGRDCGVQMMSCIRQVSWDPVLHWLLAKPTLELTQLRTRTLLKTHNRTQLLPGNELKLALPTGGAGAAMDLSIVFELPAAPSTRLTKSYQMRAPVVQYGIRVLGRTGPLLNITVKMAQDGVNKLCFVDGPLGNGPAAHAPFPITASEETLQVRVLTDRSVAEFFVAGGRASRTMRHYPARADYGVSVIGTTGRDHTLAVRSIEAFELGCGWSSGNVAP